MQASEGETTSQFVRGRGGKRDESQGVVGFCFLEWSNYNCSLLARLLMGEKDERERMHDVSHVSWCEGQNPCYSSSVLTFTGHIMCVSFMHTTRSVLLGPAQMHLLLLVESLYWGEKDEKAASEIKWK